MQEETLDKSENKSFSIRLLCLGINGTFLRTVGGILCIYYGIFFTLIGVVLTFIFPYKCCKLLKVIDPMITEWWYSIGVCGEIITLIWGIITTLCVYTWPNSLFSVISSKFIYGLGNVCACKLGSELALLNIKRCKYTSMNNDMDVITDIQLDHDAETEGIHENVTLLGDTV
eukprot:368075_1